MSEAFIDVTRLPGFVETQRRSAWARLWIELGWAHAMYLRCLESARHAGLVPAPGHTLESVCLDWARRSYEYVIAEPVTMTVNL